MNKPSHLKTLHTLRDLRSGGAVEQQADQSAPASARSATFKADWSLSGKTNLLSLDRKALEQFVVSIGEKPYRARQLMQWIYGRQVIDFNQMTDLSRASREKLIDCAIVELPQIEYDSTASDGTRKWLFDLGDGNSIETVFIPEGSRGTLCVSSQVGCALDCSFCATARQGFNRNLTTGEIIAQIWLAGHLLARDASDASISANSVTDSDPKSPANTQEKRRSPVTNVVMMGMGEPLMNLKCLIPALELMMDDLSFGLSKRKVTVSTSGVVPAMDKMIAAVDCSLAVSLHAPSDSLRDQLVPLNKKYPLAELMAACRRYVQGDRKKHVFFEYVMLAGVNDQPEHARQLAKLLRGFPAKVNLIPFNPFPAAGYVRSSSKAIETFQRLLSDAGILTVTRATRGDDIEAACGQLAGDIEDRSNRQKKFAEPRYGESDVRAVDGRVSNKDSNKVGETVFERMSGRESSSPE